MDDKTIKNSIDIISDTINNCAGSSVESLKLVSVILEAMVQEITFLHEDISNLEKRKCYCHEGDDNNVSDIMKEMSESM